jgi:hypothetical protein
MSGAEVSRAEVSGAEVSARKCRRENVVRGTVGESILRAFKVQPGIQLVLLQNL